MVQGSNPVEGRDLPHPPIPVLGPVGTGSFPGLERPERGSDHQSTSTTGVKETVELYLSFLSGQSWPVLE